jgi:hypothetical protein
VPTFADPAKIPDAGVYLFSEAGCALYDDQSGVCARGGCARKTATPLARVVRASRLDVVWKRVEKSVPTFAFEVQIGGDIYHALGKLKHAFDLWNSSIFLVIDRGSLPKVGELLGGTFHEIAPNLKVVEIEALERLQRALATVHDLEKEVGLA